MEAPPAGATIPSPGSSIAMASFLVESYLSNQTEPEPSDLAARLGAAAEALGVAVHFLRVISIPEDEICFYLFDAPSADAVRLVSGRAGLRHERILEARP
jgi:hypothetical protein